MIGASIVYATLFRRRAIVVDRGRLILIDSRRSLFTRHNDKGFPFDAIESVRVDEFLDRFWTNGSLTRKETAANVWLELADSRSHTFGSRNSKDAGTLGERLSGLTGARLRKTKAGDNPTRDTWEVSTD